MIRDFWVNVAAGAFLGVTGWVVGQRLLPFYLAWRYKAPDIRGNWAFFDSYNSNASAVGSATIHQHGEVLKIAAVRTISRDGKSTSRHFTYSGKLRDGQLVLTFEEPVAKGFISGSVVLKISSNLKALSGFTIYLDRDKGDVVAHPIVYRRPS